MLNNVSGLYCGCFNYSKWLKKTLVIASIAEERHQKNDNMPSAVEGKNYGRRLLPIVVENVAKRRPNRVAYSFPITDDPTEGFHDITNHRYANSVNRTAWWIERNFGKPEANLFPSIGYIGPCKFSEFT